MQIFNNFLSMFESVDNFLISVMVFTGTVLSVLMSVHSVHPSSPSIVPLRLFKVMRVAVISPFGPHIWPPVYVTLCGSIFFTSC